MTKLKNSNVTKLKMWQLKNSKCDKILKNNSKCDNAEKLKDSKCDKTIKKKLQNSKTQKSDITKKNHNMTRTQKLKMWQKI